MQSKGKELFRQEAIDRLSSPERLDQMMQVVNPRAWLPLSTIGFLVIAASVWSVVGRIPLTVAGQGVLLFPRSVVPLQAPPANGGKILTLNIKAGDTIKEGEIIGTIDQPSVRQQLQQAQSKLAELLAQTQQTNQLQQRDLALKQENLAKQRTTLTANLRDTESFSPILRQKSLSTLAQKRQNILQSLQQARSLVPTLKQRLNVISNLFRQGALTQNEVLQAQRDYMQQVAQLSDLEAQLKQVDSDQTQAQAEYLKNLNSIKDLKTQIQNLDVQAADLAHQNLRTSIDKTNQVQELKRQIAQFELQLATTSKIISKYNGRVLEVAMVPGQAVSPGARIGTVETQNSDSKLATVIYLADKDGKQIKPGMTIQVTPSIVKRERYGGIIGKITRVTPYPVTTQDMSALLGNENLANSIAQSVVGGGAPVQVFAELQQDPTTISGYKWSSSKGPALKISSGTTAQVQVNVGQQAPISYVIPIFKSLTGLE